MKTIQAVIIVFLCLANVNANDFVATVSCQRCTITCPFSACYRITTEDFDQEICGSTSCTLNTNYLQVFIKCQYDLLGFDCPSSICYIPAINDCAAQNLECSVPTWEYMDCRPCVNTTGCANCLFMQSKGVISERCLGDTCKDVRQVNLTIYPCFRNLDGYGNSCPCCYRPNTPSGRVGVCANNTAIYSDPNFVTYARLKTGENTLILSLALFVSLILMPLI